MKVLIDCLVKNYYFSNNLITTSFLVDDPKVLTTLNKVYLSLPQAYIYLTRIFLTQVILYHLVIIQSVLIKVPWLMIRVILYHVRDHLEFVHESLNLSLDKRYWSSLILYSSFRWHFLIKMNKSKYFRVLDGVFFLNHRNFISGILSPNIFTVFDPTMKLFLSPSIDFDS